MNRQAIKGVQDAIDDGRFSDENPPQYTEEDVDKELAEFSKFERKVQVERTRSSGCLCHLMV